jgi:hypothetical protein
MPPATSYTWLTALRSPLNGMNHALVTTSLERLDYLILSELKATEMCNIAAVHGPLAVTQAG